MAFRPCIDLYDGEVVQIVGSTLSDDPSKMSKNPATGKPATYFAELYKKHNLPGGHVIMLRCKDRKANEKAAKSALGVYPGGLQVGGGMNPQNAQEWLGYGASHVIVTSYVFRNGTIDFKRLDEMVKAASKENLVLDLSCKRIENKDGKARYVVSTEGWKNDTDYIISERTADETLGKLAESCDEILVHGADAEGKCKGPEIELVKILGDFAKKSEDVGKPIQIVYGGGIGKLNHFYEIEYDGQYRVHATAGKGLDEFGGKKIKFESVLKWHNESLGETD
ncbi:phosphoribosylformimino-5-aminoimidazole carboxamide ribotide isomerase [Nanoarchaeota archaeon]